MQAKQMLATMSNELGSPLSGVVTMAEVLATTDLHAEQRQLMDMMVTTGDLIFQLINNILDLSNIKSGAGSPLLPERFPLPPPPRGRGDNAVFPTTVVLLK
ncbi:unnamed protein product [Sphagnum troendelagicum]|uniref:histidine kinase n=1 Tax=Sphagnum jensenii TaxID=128206 RepID=A0ABP0VNR7_9BRYO